jgi:hypothetical protein
MRNRSATRSQLGAWPEGRGGEGREGGREGEGEGERTARARPREASLGEAGRSASGQPSVVHNRIRESTRPLRSPLPRTRAQVPAVNLCPAHACGARLGLRRKWATLRRREAAARSPLEGKTRSWVAARRSAKDRFAAFPHRQSADFERLVAHKVRAAMPPAAWTVTRAILGFGWMDGWMDGRSRRPPNLHSTNAESWCQSAVQDRLGW